MTTEMTFFNSGRFSKSVLLSSVERISSLAYFVGRLVSKELKISKNWGKSVLVQIQVQKEAFLANLVGFWIVLQAYFN